MKRTIPIICTVALCLALFLTCAWAQLVGPVAPSAETSSAKPEATASDIAKPDTSAEKTAEDKPDTAKTEEPAKTEPEKDEHSVAFKDMTVEKLATFFSENLKKPVLVDESIKGKKITIISKEKKPLAEVIHLIRQALLLQGIIVDQQPNLVYVRPVDQIMQTMLLRVPAEESVATVDDDLQIVTKEFLIKHYNVDNMVTVIQPMLAKFAHVVSDPDSSKFFVTDTVSNILRIEHVVAAMDVPLAERTLTEIIKLEHGDAGEIVAIVRWLIAGKMGVNVKEITTVTGGAGQTPSAPPSRGRPSDSSSGTGVTKITPSEAVVTLVPHVSRNWIIAVAPAEIMAQIKIWVKQLDKPREVEKDYELYSVEHADTDDLARQISQAFESMPAELRQTTHVVPFGQSEKLIIFGSKRGRELAINLLKEIDTEDTEKRIRKTFQLKNADAEEMADRIETLFSNQTVASSSPWYTRYREDPDAAKVTVVPDTRRNTVTVITDPDTMKDVEALIEEEDTPIDPNEVSPRIYELQYADPGELRDLLTEMFAGRTASQTPWWMPSRGEVKPVGRLLGQFMFQVMPSSNKLIVQTKSVANYEVIDRLIAELDVPQRAGLPMFIELKYANAEDLCEQLNAMLAEPGTRARIRRASRGLTNYIGDSGSEIQSGTSSSSSSSSNNNDEDNSTMTEFWWQGYRRPDDQVPVSNLIGKIRFVPVYQRNAVMVLAPAAFTEPIRELIDNLDQRGRQVVIYGRIGEIQHEDQTSLGIRIASDSSILPPADTAAGGSLSLDFTDTIINGTLILGATADVNLILNMLIEDFDMKIMAEPSLTTSDNEAAEFFDGQEISVISEVKDSSEGTSTVTDVTDKMVGTRLRIRPHITKEGSVDMMINLEISRIVPGATSAGNPIIDHREVVTHVIVQDGQTLMLSGIIQQEKFDDIRKVPILGDLPLIGPIFRTVEKGVGNRELVVFITPRVMETIEEVDEQMADPKETLEEIERSLNPDNKK